MSKTTERLERNREPNRDYKGKEKKLEKTEKADIKRKQNEQNTRTKKIPKHEERYEGRYKHKDGAEMGRQQKYKKGKEKQKQ